MKGPAQRLDHSLLAFLSFIAIGLWMPSLKPSVAPDSWIEPLQGQLRHCCQGKPDWVQIQDRWLGPHQKELQVTMPAEASPSVAAQTALIPLCGIWRKHPEVQGIKLTLHLRSRSYDYPSLALSGTRDKDSVRWVTTDVAAGYQLKMVWMAPGKVSYPALLSRLKEEGWGSTDNDGLFTSSCREGCWKRHGGLDTYLRQASRPSSKELVMMLLQGTNLDDALLRVPQRNFLGTQLTVGYWELQSSYYQHCQDGIWPVLKRFDNCKPHQDSAGSFGSDQT